jgi:acyl-CoA synthetase (AMP-forming)/AMP-acid ligase II/NAD(P)-dependent dehydrogenase (short-subunit alcohol dehydrogenase family)/acyl carrier protein
LGKDGPHLNKVRFCPGFESLEAEMSQMAVDLKAVETWLISEESVDDCAVRLREVPGAGRELVAYVVCHGEFNRERLLSFLQSKLPLNAVPSSYVPLSALPLTDKGEIDEAVLASFPVIDTELARQWEIQLEALPEIERAIVLIEENRKEVSPLHLSDLLDEGQSVAKAVAPPQDKLTPKVVSTRVVERPSICTGGKITRELPATLAQALKVAAAGEPSQGIFYVEANNQETFQSYAELLEESERILAGLRKQNLKPGDKVIFQLEPNRDFVPAFWACALGGFVPVPVSIPPSYKDLNATVTKLYHTWQMLDQPIILTSNTLASSIAALPGLLQSESFSVVTIDDLRGSATDKQWHEGGPEDVALILLTSGSTGMPKGVLLSQRNILSRSAGAAQLNDFHSEEVLFNWFPLDHVGGIVFFHVYGIYLGARQLLAPTDLILQQPLKWLDVVDKHRVTVTWSPNFAFGLVNDNEAEIKQRKWDLSCLRSIFNGGEAIVARTGRKFLALLGAHGLPATAIQPAWGMSETSSGVTCSQKFRPATTSDDMSFVEVGVPLPGLSMRIVDTHDNLVEEGEIGRLQVKGESVTKGYYKNEDLSREAFSADGWFNTGDLGVLQEGCLTITGRTKDDIIINGVNFYSHEIEGAVEEVKGVNVSFTAATAVRDPGIDTDKLAIFFSAVDGADELNLIAEIRSHVVGRIGVNPDYVIPVEKEIIPKTAIGKIQRQQLRDRFEVGEFRDRLKRLDIESANAQTIPDWFYRKSWIRREEEVRNSELLKGGYLVFADQFGLAETLCRKLGEIGNACVLVEKGIDFNKIDKNHYCLNPSEPEHFRKLIAALADEEMSLNHILHFWHYTAYEGDQKTQLGIDDAQRCGVYSLLHLVQALATSAESKSNCRLFVVANNSQPVAPADDTAPEKATVLGLLKTLPLELSWLEPRHIDLETDEVEENALRVWQELTIPKTRMEIAYRKRQRFVAALKRVNLLAGDQSQNKIKHGGTYLITGGLGGVGTELARFLVQRYRAKLILIGKTPVPPREEWQQYDKLESEVARRVKSLLDIESAGGQVCYRVVDVCDLERLRETVAEAERCWEQELSGIFHLAGGLGGEKNLEQHWTTMDSHRLVVEDEKNFHRAFVPKVFGTLTLQQLIKDRPETLFVLFSSVNSLFGGATFGAYAAANSFLDCYAQHLHNTSHPQTYCFNWSLWDDIGMSRGNPGFAREATKRMGFFLMNKDQALNSLLAGLLKGAPQLVIGIDGYSRNGSRHIELQPEARQALNAFYTPSNGGVPGARLEHMKVLDRFGERSTCAFKELTEFSLDENGEVDRGRLKDSQRDQRTTREVVAPRTDLEREVANVWREVLRVPELSIHDNFFQLGGQSLLATQVISRLRKTLNVELPMQALFEAATVALLAASIEQRRSVVAERQASRIVAVSREAHRMKARSLSSDEQSQSN